MIDLRSDTVTAPTAAMRQAMATAAVGDDVYGEDPTVNELERDAAERLGFEAAVFVPTGTQSNLIALMSHCERGDEYIVGQHAHTYRYEGGGAAVLGSIQPQPLEMAADGRIDLDAVRAAIKPHDDPHFARTRLLCLENTHYGRVLPLDYCEQAAEAGLAMHLDGARLFNAAVAAQRPVRELVAPFDSVSVCLSKGLGAPMGTVLCASAELVGRARRWKKMLGGGWRQAGIVAAAGLHALHHHVDRLADDHRRARRLAAALANIDGFRVDLDAVETNIVWVELDSGEMGELVAYLEEQGVLVSGRDRLRLVTHLDIDDAHITRVIDLMAGWR